MSRKATRKVWGFTMAQKQIILGVNLFCIKCKKEKATQADHILPMVFLRWASYFGVKMCHTSNGGGLCGKCHNLKNKAEEKINPANFKAVCLHWQKWQGLNFTPTGKRRSMTKKTVAKNKNKARRIHRAKANARKAKARGNFEMVAHYHKVAAKARREK